MDVKLSVVDQSPVPEGSSPSDALRNSIELAKLCDRLGYTRYWLAEHHAMDSLACSAPEILIDRIAAETRAIRVGSGAVLLPYYAPMKVAEQFRMLHALYPDRIDLGLGRAPGGSQLEAFALNPTRGRLPQSNDFIGQIAALRAFLYGGFPETNELSRIKVSPALPGSPDLWLLGSSPWSAAAAAELGLPYAFAHFIDPQPTRAAIEHYRKNVDPDSGPNAGRVIVALGVLCADTEEEALRHFASARLFRRNIYRGIRAPIPTNEEAIREIGLGRDLDFEESEWPRYIAGDPDQVKAQLAGMAEALLVDELMIVTVVHDHAARLRSYELLAQIFGLPPRV